MSRIFKARDYQHLMIRHMTENKRCAVWAGMGLGKTIGTLTAISILRVSDDLRGKVLVCAPLRVAQSTWPDEIAKWAHTSDMRISVICGDAKQRKKALLADADLYTINYENLPWLIATLIKLKMPWPFTMVVADEATKLKGFRLRQGSKRAQALARVAHKYCDRFIQLTGTPSPNGLIDLWGMLWFIHPTLLGRTFTAFLQRWFQKDYSGWGYDPLPFAQEQIEDRLQGVCLSLNAADYFDIEDPIEITIEVDIPAKARALYRDMERDMFAVIKSGSNKPEVIEQYNENKDEVYEVEAFGAAARTMKCLQFANGAAYVDDKARQWEEIHDAKIEALKSVVEEAGGMPVLVAYHFRSDLDRLKRAFKNGRAFDKNPQTLRDWNAGKIPLMFTHPASAGHGLNMQDGGNILAFFSINWNLEEHLQIIERIGPVRQIQAGYNRPVFIYYIMVKDTVEQMVLERLKSKRSVQDILMEAMKHREKNSAA